MSRRRFYASPDSIEASIVTLSKDETHHLTRVLRMTPGDEAFVFDGCGKEYRCGFNRVVDGRAQLEIEGELSDSLESSLRLTLAQALTKGEKFDFIVQKATELSVSRIVPLVTRYSDIRLVAEQTGRRVERWKRISLEALKQCGRRTLVEIAPPLTLPEFLDGVAHVSAANVAHAASLRTESGEAPLRKLAACATLLLFSERGGSALEEAVSTRTPHDIVALIGPEGGWSDEELRLSDEHGCTSITLGPRILRAETAAVAALTLIQHFLGDLSQRGPR